MCDPLPWCRFVAVFLWLLLPLLLPSNRGTKCLSNGHASTATDAPATIQLSHATVASFESSEVTLTTGVLLMVVDEGAGGLGDGEDVTRLLLLLPLLVLLPIAGADTVTAVMAFATVKFESIQTKKKLKNSSGHLSIE